MIAATENTTIHSQLKEKLIEMICEGNINDRLPAERKLAQTFGVSRTTIIKVMVELEQEGYVTRRVGKGTFIAPRDMTIVQDHAVIPRTTGDVIIAYPDFFSYVLWERVHFAELAALKNNLNLINVKMRQESTLQTVLNILKSNDNVVGVILVVPDSVLNNKLLTTLDQFNIPIILTNISGFIGDFNNIFLVHTDVIQSGYIKMDYLLKQGHRKIGIINNEPSSLVTTEQMKGIKQAAYDQKLRLKDLVVSDRKACNWDDPLMVGYQQTLDVLKDNDVTALLYQTIRGAFGGLRALYEMNLKCPDDISVIASLTHFGLDKMSCPAITTTDASNEELMKLAFEVITDKNKRQNNKYYINSTVIERESVKNIN